MKAKILNTYQKYDSYKDSDVDWVGDIPSDWEVVPLRTIFKFRNENNRPVITEDILSLSIANGVTKYSDSNRGGNKRKDDITAYKIARPNDIVLNSMNVVAGAVGVSRYFGAISPVYYALYIHDETSVLEYYSWVFQNQIFQRNLLKYGKGILIKFGEFGKMNTVRMKISQHDMKTLVFPKPSVENQKKIAKFLNRKSGQIDQAINLKQQQIERLNEYKQIVIQNAVTKGLDPNVPMKNSGTDWIGDVPDHWEVKAIKRISRVARGASPRPIDDPRYFDDEGEYAWVRIKDVTASNRYLTETTQSLSKLGSLLSVRMQPDEIFLSIAGSVGKPIITKIKACIHDGFVYFPDWNQSEEFLYYIFLSGQPYLGLGKIGTQLNLNSETVGSIKIGLPPIDEQKRIVEYLDIETNKANELIEFQKNQIERLKEYKTILINQAVTGKIKVS